MSERKGFDEHLRRRAGTRRSFDVGDLYERRRQGSAYFSNRASDLRAGALVVWHSFQAPVGLMGIDPEAQRLGLGEGFRLDAALPPVFSLLAGLSIELQIKAIARLLDIESRPIHRISELSAAVGIALGGEKADLADALSEYIYWAGRYPTPATRERFEAAQRLFNRVGRIALSDYDPLWHLYEAAYWQAREVIEEP